MADTRWLEARTEKEVQRSIPYSIVTMRWSRRRTSRVTALCAVSDSVPHLMSKPTARQPCLSQVRICPVAVVVTRSAVVMLAGMESELLAG